MKNGRDIGRCRGRGKLLPRDQIGETYCGSAAGAAAASADLSINAISTQCVTLRYASSEFSGHSAFLLEILSTAAWRLLLNFIASTLSGMSILQPPASWIIGTESSGMPWLAAIFTVATLRPGSLRLVSAAVWPSVLALGASTPVLLSTFTLAVPASVSTLASAPTPPTLPLAAAVPSVLVASPLMRSPAVRAASPACSPSTIDANEVLYTLSSSLMSNSLVYLA